MAQGIAHLTHLVEKLGTQMDEALGLLRHIDQTTEQLQQSVTDALPTSQDLIDIRSDIANVAKIDPVQKGS